MTARHVGLRPAGLAAMSVLLATFVSACGIQATEVPTDFGPAPSRMPCTAPEQRPVDPPQGLPVQVFLLCAGRLVGVDRTIRVPEGAKDGDRRVLMAQALLAQLVRKPTAVERMSGYTTSVLADTTVTGPRKGDPADGLRLSIAPRDLSTYALSQIVCTFSDSGAAEGDGSVVLGGPGDEAPLRYDCTPDVHARPWSGRPLAAGGGGG